MQAARRMLLHHELPMRAPASFRPGLGGAGEVALLRILLERLFRCRATFCFCANCHDALRHLIRNARSASRTASARASPWRTRAMTDRARGSGARAESRPRARQAPADASRD